MDYITWGKSSLQRILRSGSVSDSDKQTLTQQRDENYRTFSFPVTRKVPEIFLENGSEICFFSLETIHKLFESLKFSIHIFMDLIQIFIHTYLT